MVTVGVLVRLEAKPGREDEVAGLLLSGAVAAALMERAPELFVTPPAIEGLDVLAAKLLR
ncbi:MAG TPA: hypothetical protein VFA46_09090 [Actinomycetes bacterium]|jgi:hypothetical protein|nr:hypothetical protein [Actinomycetes bacterium]